MLLRGGQDYRIVPNLEIVGWDRLTYSLRDMTFTSTPGSLKRFRRTPWKFQQTFLTPLKDLERFVSIIISAHPPPEKACVTIDQVVFAPKTLKAFLSQHSISEEVGHDISLEAVGQQEIEELLRSTLADWIDFVFIPTPKPFVIYADHDEYTTFYANTQGNLNRIVDALSEKRFEKVEDYERNL